MAAQYLAAASAQGDENAETVLQSLLEQGDDNRHTGLDPSIFLPPSWILTQNPNHYTIQVIGLSSLPKLQNLVNNHHHLAPFAVYTLQRKNKPLHLLIQGVYPDVNAAREAKARFPRAIQKTDELWIRQFIKIQQLILSEDTPN
jgi:hypothetical protein